MTIQSLGPRPPACAHKHCNAWGAADWQLSDVPKVGFSSKNGSRDRSLSLFGKTSLSCDFSGSSANGLAVVRKSERGFESEDLFLFF